jgi:hypothetical protein
MGVKLIPFHSILSKGTGADYPLPTRVSTIVVCDRTEFRWRRREILIRKDTVWKFVHYVTGMEHGLIPIEMKKWSVQNAEDSAFFERMGK